MEIKGTGRLQTGPLILPQALRPNPDVPTTPTTPTPLVAKKAVTDQLSLKPSLDDFAAVLDEETPEEPGGDGPDEFVTFGGSSSSFGSAIANRIEGLFAGERIVQHFCNTCAAAVSMDQYARKEPKNYESVRDSLAESPHETVLPNGDEVSLHADDKAAIDAHAETKDLSPDEVRDMYLEAAVTRHYTEGEWSAAKDMPPASGKGLTQTQADRVAEAFNGDMIRVPQSQDASRVARFMARLDERLTERGDKGLSVAVSSGGGQEHLVHVVQHKDGNVSINDANGPYPAGAANPRPKDALIGMLPIGKSIDDIGGARVTRAATGYGDLI